MAQALDFLVAGFPKCGTTSMRVLMEMHDEINVLHKYRKNSNGKEKEVEYFLKLGKNFYLDDLAEDLRENSVIGKKNGIKWPLAVANDNVESISKLQDYNPEGHHTKIIIGMRHPVRWFESFYNFRVLLNRDMEEHPDPYSMIGDISNHWQGVYTDLARWELSLMQLGKWDLSPTDIKELAANGNEIISTPYPVFLYDVDQMADPDDDRAASFRQDLSDFLDLKETFQAVPHGNDHHDSNFKDKIDICDSHYDGLRHHIVSHGKETADWLTRKLDIKSDVVIGGKDHFRDLIQKWGEDPCEATTLF